MVRLIWFLVKITFIALASVWVFRNPGTVRIQWQGYEIHSTFALTLLATVASFTIILYVWRTFKYLACLPWHIRRAWRKKSADQGIEALYQVFIALEQEDNYSLEKALALLKRKIREPALVLYLEGIAARSSQMTTLAQEKFQALSALTSGHNLGDICALKMTLMEKNELQVWLAYERLADKSILSTSLLQEILGYTLTLHKFDAAQEILAILKRQKNLTVEQLRALRSQVALSRSRYFKDVQYNEEAAYIAAQEAYDLNPSTEASLELFSYFIRYQKKAKAKDLLRKAWINDASLPMLDLFKELEPEMSALDTYISLKKWAEEAPFHPARQMTLALGAYQAQLWGESRSILAHLPSDWQHSSQKTALEAQIELQEHNNLEKALKLYQQAVLPAIQ